MKLVLLLLSIALVAAGIAVVSVADTRYALVSYASETKVDPRVWQDTVAGQTGHFLVVLARQADTKASARSARTPADRGQLVYDSLRGIAQASQDPIRAELASLGAPYRPYWIVNAIAVAGDRHVVEALAARPDVKAIEPDRPFRVALEAHELAPAYSSGIEWNLTKVNAPVLWEAGITGQNVVYANADTGVKWDHPALVSKYRGWNGAGASHDYNWWDAIRAPIGIGGNPCGYGSPVPCDDNGHGTHTTGIGVGDDGAGNRVGVAPGAKWIACRNMDSGIGRPSTYIECLQFFLAPTDRNGKNPDPSKRPNAVGNSYGCPPDELCSPDSLLAAVDNLRAAGVFMAVSAGNAGSAGCSSIVDPPAIYDSAITVGATDQNDAIAPFSSRGPVTAGGANMLKPDLVAPGVGVRSSYLNGYASLSGTSMAAPHVAGAALLLWSAFPQLRGDVNRTEALLAQHARPLTSIQGCGNDSPSAVPNNVYGYGRIDVLAARDAIQSGATMTGTVTFQAREVLPPAAPYSVSLDVRLLAPGITAPVYGNTLHTDAFGRFTLFGVTGTYTIAVKSIHTLSNQRPAVDLGPGATEVALCLLLEGDANGDDKVNIADFSILAGSYGKVAGQAGFDLRGDFNNSGQINIVDFSALASNYGRQGPLPCPR